MSPFRPVAVGPSPLFTGLLALTALIGQVSHISAQVCSGTVIGRQKISETVGGLGAVLDPFDLFGAACAPLGDLDGDGIPDIAVGSLNDNDGGSPQGAVWILFLNANGTVKAKQKISETAGGLGNVLDSSDLFGGDLAALGDLDDDGVEDLAVGALRDSDTGVGRGAVWILFLNSDGTVKAKQKINEIAGGLGNVLDDDDQFGLALAALGDLDGDGVEDLAVGANGDDDGGFAYGAVRVLFLNTNGTVKAQQKISATSGGFSGALDIGDSFGFGLAPIGDLDGNGSVDLAVGAQGDDDGGADQGAVWILYLDSTGMVVAHQKISETSGGFGSGLDPEDRFAFVGPAGDVNGDGALDLAVGTPFDDDGGGEQGAVWIVFLKGADVTAPNITCPSSLFALDQKGGPLGEIVSFTVTATDNCDPSPSLVCVPPSGSFFPPGTTTVVCTATDENGNTLMCSFPVTVSPSVKRR
jgi:hypothetical protein